MKLSILKIANRSPTLSCGLPKRKFDHSKLMIESGGVVSYIWRNKAEGTFTLHSFGTDHRQDLFFYDRFTSVKEAVGYLNNIIEGEL